MELQKWEYKVLRVETVLWNKSGLPPDLSRVRDELGEDRWELVRVEPILKGGIFFLFIGTFTYTRAFVLFFKRLMR